MSSSLQSSRMQTGACRGECVSEDMKLPVHLGHSLQPRALGATVPSGSRAAAAAPPLTASTRQARLSAAVRLAAAAAAGDTSEARDLQLRVFREQLAEQLHDHPALEGGCMSARAPAFMGLASACKITPCRSMRAYSAASHAVCRLGLAVAAATATVAVAVSWEGMHASDTRPRLCQVTKYFGPLSICTLWNLANPCCKLGTALPAVGGSRVAAACTLWWALLRRATLPRSKGRWLCTWLT